MILPWIGMLAYSCLFLLILAYSVHYSMQKYKTIQFHDNYYY